MNCSSLSAFEHRCTDDPLAVDGSSGAACLSGDSLAVANSTALPSGKVNWRTHLTNFHRVREAQATKTIRFVHVKGTGGPADVSTKARSTTEWRRLMKPLMSKTPTNGLKELTAEGSKKQSPGQPLEVLNNSNELKQTEGLPLPQTIGTC